MILEKASRFGPRDVAERLCVLLLMLPSANRETKEQLRMFRDRGGFESFFPADDDDAGHEDLLQRTSNLDTFAPGVFGGARHAKTSLGNVLRIHQPLIILDEGHKAYSRRARDTLAGFNPCLIVELSATPPKAANVLVDIRGRELHAEEMIKLDLHIMISRSVEWKDTLLKAIQHRADLEREARTHEAATGVYIRPICLIQVERTGKEQRGTGFIHAEDAREYLLAHPGIRPEHVAAKTSQRDELKDVDDLGGLLSRDCPIRFIITKQALQEGWDCAFAYVLAILTNPSSKSALTQLVGRILRQPYARKTGVTALDESYVFAFRRQGEELLRDVRRGFGQEGLEDLEGRLQLESEDPAPGATIVTVRQRRRYRKAAHEMVLPAFMIRDGGTWRPVHYEADILSRVPWEEVDLSSVFELSLSSQSGGDLTIHADLEGERVSQAQNGASEANGEINTFFASRHLLDAAPNPWRGHEFARRAFGELTKKYGRALVAGNYVHILEELRKRISSERDRLAERVFRELLDCGAMRFLVVTSELQGTRLPPTIIRAKEECQANRGDGAPFQRSLFDPMGESELNGLENKVATYLDEQERLFFWYRNRARNDYFVQGWRRHRIFADFIVTLRPDEPDPDDAYHQVFVLETKGLHLREGADTAYKRSVFDLCSQRARKTDWAEFVPSMRNRVLRYEIVDEEEWEQRLNTLLADGPEQA